MSSPAVLGGVVGPDLLGAIARADLREAFGAFGGLLLGEHLHILADRDSETMEIVSES